MRLPLFIFPKKRAARLPVQFEQLEERAMMAADLRPIDFTAPNSALLGSGQQVQLEWTVSVEGDTPVTQDFWFDSIYLSDDDQLDPSDTLLTFLTAGPPESPNTTYSLSTNVTLPIDSLAGNKYLLLVVDDGDLVSGEQSETNNILASPLLVIAPDVDLTVDGSIRGGSSVVAGQFVTLDGIVYNTGADAALAPRTQRVYLSVDDFLDPSDPQIASFTETTALAGTSFSPFTLDVTIPGSLTPGNYTLFLTTDDDNQQYETNDFNNGISLPITVVEAAPDLIVSAPVAETLWSAGQFINFEFTVTNTGTSETTGFQDGLYLSTDEFLDSSDLQLLGIPSPGILLAPGDSYGVFNSFVVPNLPIGNYYLLAVADDGNYVNELNESNNFASLAVTIATANLAVTAVSTPGNASPGDFVSVEATVVNAGNGPTSASFWTDAIYLSTDDVLDPSDLVLNVVFEEREGEVSLGPVLPTESYTQNFFFTMPSAAAGSYYLIVVANDGLEQAESDRSDNTFAVPFNVNGNDVAGSNLIVNSPIILGSNVDLTYTVTNNSVDPINELWTDRFYLSDDNVLDASDVLIDSLDYTANLASGASDTVTRTVRFDVGTPGNKFVLVQVRSNVPDTNPSNNVLASVVVAQAPDLAVTNFTGPSSIILSSPFTLSWSATNQGTVVAPGDWLDAVYLSTDTTLDSGDIFVSSSFIGSETPLAPGGSYSRTLTNQVVFNNVASGSYYLILYVGRSGQPDADPSNNVSVLGPVSVNRGDLRAVSFSAPSTGVLGSSISISYTVDNPSLFPTGVNWSDAIYLSNDAMFSFDDLFVSSTFEPGPVGPGSSYTRSRSIPLTQGTPGPKFLIFRTDTSNAITEVSETNNFIAVSITLTAPDLAVTSLTGPSVGGIGQSISLQYTVENQGTVTASADWFDNVQLLDTNQNVVALLTQRFAGPFTPLAAGGTYSQSFDVVIPSAVAPGSYTIRVTANGSSVQPETTRQNNSVSISIQVSQPNVDLTPTNISVSPSVLIGQPFDLSYTVQNLGSVAPGVGWQDSIYLSDDNVLDPGDTLLAFEARSATPPLAGGTSYTVTRSISLPSTAAGPKFIIVVTDSVNQIAEIDEANNRLAVPLTVTGADLISDILSIPDSVTFGTPFNLTYLVRNAGTGPTTSNWTDRILLSDAAQTFSVVVGSSRTEGITLLPDGTYTRTVTVTIPTEFVTGSYRLSVQTDAAGEQLETNDTNNVNTSSPRPMTLPPLPDLVTTAVVVPSAGIGGQQFLLRWTTTNQGTATATGPWRDRVTFVSDTLSLVAGDYLYTQNLAPGDSITREEIVTFPLSPQSYRIQVEADVFDQVPEGLNDPNVFVTAPIVVSAPLLPDLVVTAITPPPSGSFSGTKVPITFTVTNVGNAATNAGYWSDYVFISAESDIRFNDGTTVRDDEQINRQRYRPVAFANQSYLEPGQSYTTTVDFELPEDAAGPYYLYVFPDGIGFHFPPFQLRESDRQNNLARSGVFSVNLTPPPDLDVTSVVSAPILFSGQLATVQWTVTNAGTGSTKPISWTDRVYLSTDAVLDASDIALPAPGGQFFFERTGPLPAGASYSNVKSVFLPEGISGSYFLIVETDSQKTVFEAGLEGNNTGATVVPISVLLTPPPDLVVDSITAPDAGIASRSLNVSYVVTNRGATDTPSVGTIDRIYLSTDSVFSPDDVLLGEVLGQSLASLSVGSSYSRSVIVTLPDGISGTYQILVLADAGQQVFEVDRANNQLSRSIAITSQPADLVVSSLFVPSSLLPGQLATVNWTVTNIGTGDTEVSRWFDKLYLSTDGTMNNLRLLASFAQDGVLGAGQSRARQASFSVPTDVSGPVWFYLRTDAPVTRLEDGPSAVLSGPGGFVFEDGPPENNWASTASSILPLFANLTVSSPLSVPSTIFTGQSFTATYTVRNDGSVGTGVDTWTDDVYLSTDTTLDASDLFLGSKLHTGALAPGESYVGSITTQVPATLTGGPIFVLVAVDRPRSPLLIVDLLVNRVAEGTGESDNVAAQGVTLVESPAPDLAVTQVTASDTTILGRSLGVSWTVSNLGTVPATGSWYDNVYLSVDQVFDPLQDRFLFSFGRAGSLGAGQSYTRNATLDLPAGLSGSYYLFVSTDAAQTVFERGTRANNASYDQRVIGIALGEPVDLVLGNIIVPVSGEVGRQATIAYTVTNQSPLLARGPWEDALYLSKDDVLDASDPLFARIRRTGDLAANTSYSTSATAALPLLPPGSYRVILRTDLTNQVREGNEANNVGASLDAVALEATPLSLGVSQAESLTAGEFRLFAVDVPAGQTLKISWDGFQPTSSAEIYVQFGRIATRSDYLLRAATPGVADPSLIVPTTQAGTYYILLRSPVAVLNTGSILAEALPFGIDSVSPGRVGNRGPVTLEIDGALFTRQTRFELIDPIGLVIPATWTVVTGGSKAYATFNLTDALLGSYALRATTPAGAVSLVSGVVTVDASVTAGQLSSGVTVPPIALINTIDNFSVTYTNNGTSDLIAPLFLLTSPTSTPFGTNPDLLAPDFVTNFVGTSPDGPAGILRPGQVVTRTFRFQAPPNVGQAYRFELFYFDANQTDSFDWNSTITRIDPRIKANPNFPAILSRLQERTGPTIGDFVRMLSRNATLLPPELGDSSQVEPLVSLELEQAIADLGTSLRGKVVTDDLAVDVSGRGVYAVNLDTRERYVTTSLNDGSFTFSSLTEGTYRLTFDGALADPTPIVVPAEGVTNALLSLERGAMLAGQIRTPGLLGVANAQVRLLNADGVEAYRVTDAQGRYVIEGLVGGTYRLIVDAPGYARAIETNIVLGTDDQTRDVTLTPESVLTGTVTYISLPLDSTPLRVVITGAAAGNASTDPAQVYTFETLETSLRLGGLRAGTYDLRFERAGSVPLVLSNVVVGSASTVSFGNVNLQFAGSIQGTLVSSDPLTPIDITIVSVYQGDNLVATAVTDSAGGFRVDGLAPGTYSLRVDGSTGLQSSAPVLVTSGATALATISILSGSTIQGTVTDSLTGSPLSGVEVVLRRPNGTLVSTLSDDFGRYSFSRLAIGTYSVSIFPGSVASVAVTDADNAVFDANLFATVAASIGGEVRLANGEVLAGAGVVLIENGKAVAIAVTDELGMYQFLLRRAGNFSLEVNAPGASFVAQSLGAVSSGDVIDADFVAGTGSIVVSLNIGGAPPTAGGVRLFRVGGPEGRVELSAIETDAGGLASFFNLSPGTYQLVAESDTLGASTTISLSDGESQSLSLTLVQQATLSGTVTGPGSFPIAGATVILYLSGSTIPVSSVGTNAQGEFLATNLADGTYDVVVVEEGYAQSVTTVVVAGATVRNISLTTSLRSLTGVVVDEAGQPVAGASVVVKDSAGRVAGQATSNAAGEFTITSAGGSGLSLVAQRVGFSVTELTGLSIAAGATVNVGNVAIESVALGATAFGPAPVVLRMANEPFAAQAVARRDVWLKRLQERYEATLDEFIFLLRFGPPPLPDCSQCGGAKAAADSAFARVNEQFSRLNQTGSRMLVKVAEFQTRAAADVAEIYAQILLALGFAELLTVATTNPAVLAAAFGAGAENFTIVFQIIKWADTAKSVVTGIQDALPKVLSMLDAGSKEDTRSAAERTTSTVSTILKTASYLKFVFKDYKILFETAGDISTVLSKVLGNGFKKTLELADQVDQIVKEFDRDKEELERRRDDYFEKLAKYEKCLADEATTRDEICKCKKNPSSCKPPDPIPSKPDGTGGGGGSGTGGSPKDPNDILGPAGFSDQQIVSAQRPLDYTVRFENVALAGLPAQQVVIRSQLDTDLDFRTFRVGSFGWGSFEFEAPTANQPFLNQRIDLTSTLGFYVDVIANVDTLSGEAQWILTTIDPATGLPPADPRIGFLPPNVTGGIGQGFVRYTIAPKASAPTGTVIDAKATIVFDTQGPIDTNVWTNVLDAVGPTSSVSTLPASSAPEFLVSWSASDDADGSGIAGVTIYVAVNEGPFQIWLSNTTARQATFFGESGKRYSFYSVAQDNAGNVELPPTLADASTQVPNPAPFVTIAGASSVARGFEERFTFTISNASPAPGLGYLFYIDWNNDGTYDQLGVSATPTVTVAHTFTGTGPQTIRVDYLSPTQQLVASESKTISVGRFARRADENDPTKVDLLLAGTDGADRYQITQLAGAIGPILRVRVLQENGVASSDVFDVTGVTASIRVQLGKGDDYYDGSSVSLPTILDGGEGNDTILTGSGNDVIDGDSTSAGNDYIDAGAGNDIIRADGPTGRPSGPFAGNDTILGGEGDDIIFADGAEGGGADSIDGGAGRDIIFAGGGKDTVRGGSGSDLILAGKTTLSLSQVLLVQSEWTSPRSLAERVANISGTGSGPRNNGNAFLIPGVTALDDDAVDTILGEEDDDWLLVDSGKDVASDFDPLNDILTSLV